MKTRRRRSKAAGRRWCWSPWKKRAEPRYADLRRKKRAGSKQSAQVLGPAARVIATRATAARVIAARAIAARATAARATAARAIAARAIAEETKPPKKAVRA